MIGNDCVDISQKGLQAAVAKGRCQCQLLTGICSLRDYTFDDNHVGIRQKGFQTAMAEGRCQCQLLLGICSLHDYMIGKNRVQI